MSISERYQLLKKLGGQHKRKFGETYLAQSRSDQSLAVLKAVRKTAGSEAIAERLRCEAQFSFDFKGLSQVLDFYESDSEVLLLKPYIDGKTIDVHWNSLKRRERLPFIIDLVKQLLPIFEELNRKDIVHCDLKPSNLIVDPLGNIHLIDFGLAVKKNVPEQRGILFPLGYAAPELLLNHLDIIDQRTDIFSLGTLIWRLYAGKLPLVHPNPSIFTNLQLTHPLPQDTNVPSKVYNILAKMAAKHQFSIPPNKLKGDEVKDMLRKGMDARYSNLSEVLGAFEKIRKKSWFTT